VRSCSALSLSCTQRRRKDHRELPWAVPEIRWHSGSGAIELGGPTFSLMEITDLRNRPLLDLGCGTGGCYPPLIVRFGQLGYIEIDRVSGDDCYAAKNSPRRRDGPQDFGWLNKRSASRSSTSAHPISSFFRILCNHLLRPASKKTWGLCVNPPR
jgi:hypothetical protein